MPIVSVIIPNYNHYPHLRQRILSVLDQTYKDLEVIILDDASTDDSREIIREYSVHPLVSEIVLNEKNGGNPFRQWKRGISLAKGEWIWIAESDDYADERFLEIMVPAVRGLRNIGLAYCDSAVVEGGRVSHETFASIKNRKYGTTRWNEDYRCKGIDEIENYLLPFGTINNTSAVLFNREILVDANPFDLDLKHIGDKYAFIKVLAKSDIVYVKNCLNYYRDPFNTKPASKSIYYFYEQFVVFDYAYKNLPLTHMEAFYRGFYSNTRNSLFRDWTKLKINLYKDLCRLNFSLFAKSVVNNFARAIGSLFAVAI